MERWLSRTFALVGQERLDRLKNAHITLLGLGGVGSYAAEALVRLGIGEFTLVDGDCYDETNINRQLHADVRTVGEAKVNVVKRNMEAVNPAVIVTVRREFVTKENVNEFLCGDYIVDCIDNISAKIALVCGAKERGLRIISAMGAGNKLDPSGFIADDIYNTSVCPLCRVMRHELKRRGVDALKVVYSKELPVKMVSADAGIPASISFVPAAMGLVIASQIFKDYS